MHYNYFANSSKKALTLIMVICFFSGTVFSQDIYTNKESAAFSFTLGLTSSDLYHDTVNYSPGILFNGGLVYTLAFSEKINCGIELLYTGKALRKENPLTKYRFGYLDLPLYLQYKFSEGIKANIGFQYSTILNAQYLFVDPSKANGMHKKPLSTGLHNDFGVLLGVEFNINKNLGIAARYTLSAKSFVDNGQPYLGVFQLSFKYVVFRSYKQYFHKKKIAG
jgi:hypothetical protein